MSALIASTLCLAHVWPRVSAIAIAVIGLAVSAMAWRDWKLGIRINWEEAFNPEHYIPMVIEDYAEECCDYDKIKRGEDGCSFGRKNALNTNSIKAKMTFRRQRNVRKGWQ